MEEPALKESSEALHSPSKLCSVWKSFNREPI